MAEFSLKIVTPEGTAYDGNAEKVIVRAVMGDVCILSGHADYVSPIEKGRVKITSGKTEKAAMCEGGFISVKKGAVKIAPEKFAWNEGA
ncbi:MAG: hypothetical protein IJG06_04705 [Clostridia bacterium]|nr:hypothetical protein [Clostridia bacterium]